MKCLVDAYEMKAQNPVTSLPVDHVRDEIASMLDQVIKDGSEEGSDAHYYDTQLLKKKENRGVFITMKTSIERINCLKKAWEDRKSQ